MSMPTALMYSSVAKGYAVAVTVVFAGERRLRGGYVAQTFVDNVILSLSLSVAVSRRCRVAISHSRQ